MRNALAVVSLIGTAVVPPLGGQTIQVAPGASSSSMVSVTLNDTTITIRNGDRDNCEVKVKGRTLAKEEAAKVCEAHGGKFRFFGPGSGELTFELNKLRDILENDVLLDAESLNLLRDRQLALSKELQSRSLAFSKEGMDLALRSLDKDRVGKVFSQYLSNTQGGRPIIGVTVDPQARETDRHGAFVVGVTPNGPADKAGIKVNDIIVEVDGKAVTGRTDRAVDGSESPTWIKLTEIVGKLEPGKEVALEYRRGGQVRSTKVKPMRDNRFVYSLMSPDGDDVRAYTFGDGEPNVFSVRPPAGLPDEERWFGQLLPLQDGEPSTEVFGFVAPEPGRAFFSFGRFSDLELTALNEGLGKYFGTDRGVLVVEVRGENDSLGLEAGDVVLAIGDREVDSPTAMLRILRSYESGESLSLRIMRNKRTQTVTRILP